MPGVGNGSSIGEESTHPSIELVFDMFLVIRLGGERRARRRATDQGGVDAGVAKTSHLAVLDSVQGQGFAGDGDEGTVECAGLPKDGLGTGVPAPALYRLIQNTLAPVGSRPSGSIDARWSK